MNIHLYRGRVAALCLVAAAAASSAYAGGPCPPDINNDNLVNVGDLLAVVNAWGQCTGACQADVAPGAGDGVVNTQDLLGVVSSWGPCAGSGCTAQNGCLQGTLVWCENFETQNYDRWTGGYDEPTSCESNGFSAQTAHGGTRSHKSQVLCSTPDSHRGYGGLRFQGNNVLPSYTNSPGGIDAPYGVVVTQWSWLDSGYTFDSNRWFSFLTCTPDCTNQWQGVLGVNIDDASLRLKVVHVDSITYAPNAPAFPRGQWNRIKTYINFYTGQMHVWQNGQKVCSGTFTRPLSTACQWHFGLYASGPNNNVTLYEDDYSIVKLSEPMANFNVEPTFPNIASPCGVQP